MAEAEHALPDRFAVGEWIADPDSLSLTRGADVRVLEPQAFRVLRYLAERPQRLVTIDELLDALWPGVVVTPNSVTRIIARLRKSLGDDAKQPRYIQTVARSGYRLIARVGPAATEPARPRRLAGRAGLVAMVAALIAAAVLLGDRLTPDRRHDASVAVLPFENYTGDESLVYLGEGIAEEVINSLAQVPGLQVSARSLSFQSPEAGLEPRRFARDLGVAYLVEGSVRKSGQQLRITAQVVSVRSGFHLWSRTEERNQLELSEAQDAISSGVTAALADALELEFVPPARPAAPDAQAYALYLRGRYVWHNRGAEPLQPAIDAFAEAVRIDPHFARGWAALASAYLTYPSYSSRGYATWHLAEGAATKALELDPGIAEPYAVLGTFAETRLQWIEAHALFVEALRRGARSATAHYWYSEHLANTGRYRDSLEHLRKAMELDPLYMPPRTDAAFAYLQFGDYARGAKAFQELWEAGRRSPVVWMGNLMGCVLTGAYDDARQLIVAAHLTEAQKAVMRRYVDVEAGEGDALRLAGEVFSDPGLQFDHRLLTWLGSRLGAYEQVIAYLEQRVAAGRYVDPRPLWGPATGLSAHPRFIDLLEKLRLIEYWHSVAWGDMCRPRGEEVVCDAAGLTPADLEVQPHKPL